MVHYPPILREILLQFIFGLELTRLMQSGGNLAPAGAAQDPKAEEARGRPEGQQGEQVGQDLRRSHPLLDNASLVFIDSHLRPQAHP